jgi:hypothetical protein
MKQWKMMRAAGLALLDAAREAADFISGEHTVAILPWSELSPVYEWESDFREPGEE